MDNNHENQGVLSYLGGAKPKKNKGIVALKIIGIVLLCLIFVIISVLGSMSFVAICNVDKNYFDGGVNTYIADGTAMVSAHRAGSLVAPENTLNAFELGIREATTGGYTVDIWEFDLHVTKDGALILLHDDTLDRTSNAEQIFGDKKVKPEDYTLAELKRLNMGYDFELKGEYPFRNLTDAEIDAAKLRICTLDDVFTYLSTKEAKAAAPAEYGKFRYIIEIKNGGDNGKKAADGLHAALVKYDLVGDCVFGTFKQGVSDYMDEKYPDILRSSSICEVMDFYLCYLFKVDLSKRNLGYCALQIPYSSSLSFLGKREIIEYAHKYNIAVQYWTVNEADDIAFLNSIGADCIMSDNPDVCYEVLKGDKAA